jgi:transposase InsO family protein
MESFFSSLKTERTARKVCRLRDQAKADVFDYIERFYNPNAEKRVQLTAATRLRAGQNT